MPVRTLSRQARHACARCHNVLPFDGPDLVVLFSTGAAGFAAIAALVQPILDSLEIDKSP